MSTTLGIKMAVMRFAIILLIFISVVRAEDVDSGGNGNIFFVGTYIYDYQMQQVATEIGVPYGDYFEKHLNILKNNGVNAIHLAVNFKDLRFLSVLHLAQKLNMGLILQLDFAYFQPNWTIEDISAYAKIAATFINKHKQNPNILAWSVKEEVHPDSVDKLARYHSEISKHSPGANFTVVHSRLAAASNLPEPNPTIYGVDRYAFWWEFSGGGYLATPKQALDWTRSQSRLFYETAADRKAKFMLTVTQGGMLMPRMANDMFAADSADRYSIKLIERVEEYANKGSMG